MDVATRLEMMSVLCRLRTKADSPAFHVLRDDELLALLRAGRTFPLTELDAVPRSRTL